MPQEIRVLQCFGCNVFQVDIVKKSKKWKCRVCVMQQTVRKEYFCGTGKECRTKAQELNMQKGLKQKKDFDYMLEMLNDNVNNEVINYKRNDGSNTSGEDENNWCDFDDAQNNASVMEHNQNEYQNIVETTHNMFKFSNTKKWSTDKPEENTINHSNMKHNVGSAKKKSKWDNYI